MYNIDLLATELALIPSVFLSSKPSLLQMKSTLLVIPLAAVMVHCNFTD